MYVLPPDVYAFPFERGIWLVVCIGAASLLLPSVIVWLRGLIADRRHLKEQRERRAGLEDALANVTDSQWDMLVAAYYQGEIVARISSEAHADAIELRARRLLYDRGIRPGLGMIGADARFGLRPEVKKLIDMRLLREQGHQVPPYS